MVNRERTQTLANPNPQNFEEERLHSTPWAAPSVSDVLITFASCLYRLDFSDAPYLADSSSDGPFAATKGRKKRYSVPKSIFASG
jgi:hypothetical protein